MHRSGTARVGILGIALAFGMAGCAGTPVSEEARAVKPVSEHAWRNFREARGVWVDARRVHMSVAELSARQDQAIEILERARSLAPGCLLFFTKIGDLHLELGEAAAARARYTEALERCADWTPAWLGLARANLLEGQPAAALDCLEGARWSLESLDSWGTPLPPGLGEVLAGLLGINLPPPVLERDFFDPSMDPKDARAVAFRWLEEGLAWSVDNASLVRSDAVFAAQSIAVSNRLKARMLYYEAYASLLQEEGEGGLSALAQQMDRVLEFDPEFFEACLVKAQVLADAGNFDAAYPLIKDYFFDRNPMLAHHDGLNVLMADVFLSRYLAEGARDRLVELTGYFLWLEEAQGGFQRGVWRAAQLFVLALYRQDRKGLEEALGVLEREPPEGAREGRIAALLRSEVEGSLDAARVDG